MEVGKLVSWSLLFEHGFALLLLWACVGLTGCALLANLRIGIGLAGTPLLGVVYWTLALYLVPFLAGLTSRGASSSCWQRFLWRRQWVWRFRARGSTLILLLGCLPYVTTLLYHHVPLGMDGSMHTAAAAVIAHAHGLPASYAPFQPEIPFPAVNLGLPAVAAVATRLAANRQRRCWQCTT